MYQSVVCIALFTIAGGYTMLGCVSSQRDTNSSGDASPRSNDVTREPFSQLRRGMPLEEVSVVLGRPPDREVICFQGGFPGASHYYAWDESEPSIPLNERKLRILLVFAEDGSLMAGKYRAAEWTIDFGNSVPALHR